MLLQPEQFRPGFSQTQLDELEADLAACKLPKETYQSTQPKYGITHSWMKEALRYWKQDFDWKKCEERFNDGIDHFKVDVDGYNIHFMAHYSPDPNATTLLFLHGWPGSFVEFVDVFKILKTSTNPSFNLICPSQLGYGFSSDPPIDKYFGMYEQADIFHSLMVGLGFGSGYACQGGDIGSVIARIMASKYEAVKAVNINYMPIAFPINETPATLNLNIVERENAEKAKVFAATGRGYGIMHGTRPSTIGLVVQSSPIALLAWLGEKFRDWTDDDLSLDAVLETTTLWWIQGCFPKAIYAYEQLTNGVGAWHQDKSLYIRQPFGYSSFAKEIASAPKSWAAETGNLVYYNYLEKGGHFAALERPEDFAEEMKKCFGKIYPRN